MARYVRRSNDLKYRKVSLCQSKVPQYLEFTAESQGIDYTSDQVLEVLCSDGTENLFYDHNNGRRQPVECTRRNGGEYMLNIKPAHTARLYIQGTDGMVYKIPGELPAAQSGNKELTGTCWFLLPQNAGDMKIVGDKYFVKAYDVSMI